MKNHRTIFVLMSLLGLLASAFLPAALAQAKKDPAEGPAKPPAEAVPAAARQPATSPAPNTSLTDGAGAQKELRLNFRGVPLEMVLNYLSEAAGFIIVLETKVE